MKRRQFIALWKAIREFIIQRCVKEKTMRQSEAAMTLASLDDEALKLWNKHRKTYRQADADWLLRATQIPVEQWETLKGRASQ